MVKITLLLLPSMVALTMIHPETTVCAAALKVPVVAPAGTVTLAGTANALLVELSGITTGPFAAAEMVTVHGVLVPVGRLVGLVQVNAVSVRGASRYSVVF